MTPRRWLLVATGPVVWLILSSLAFLGIAGLWGNPRIPAWSYGWQWITYSNYFGRSQTEEIYLGISAAAGLVPFLMAWRIVYMWRHRKLRLRPGLDGQPQSVIRGGSDNHGHAEWMTMQDAQRLLRPSPGGEPCLVIGEAYRVDLDRTARMPFNPRQRATWGKGGTAPLLCDPCLDGPTHSIVFAGSGGLKTSCAITRLLHWTGNAIVLDPSREIGPMVRAAREAMGQTVVELGLDGVGLNVLAGINPNSPNAPRRLLSAVASLCGEEAERDANAIFRDAGRNMVAAVLAHIIYDDALPPECRTLAFFRELITTPEHDMKRLLDGIARTTKSTTARLMASTLLGLAEETFSSAYFNATQFTSWLFDDAIVDMLSGGTFNAADVVTKPVTVFVQVPLDVLITTPAVARVILDALAWSFIEADGVYASRTLFLVDEASKIGRMKSVEIVRDTGRKYGLTLSLNFLSEAEVSEVWGKHGLARWFSNLSWRGYGAVSDRETAKGLSEDTGTFAVLATSEGDNSGTSARGMEMSSRSRGANTSTHEISRPLIKPSELMEARADELFVIRKSGPPLRCGQAPYFRRPELARLVRDNRFVRIAAE